MLAWHVQDPEAKKKKRRGDLMGVAFLPSEGRALLLSEGSSSD
jgi:hypothetical protein